jgi:DNA-3-methyladenine glycosylase II
MFAIEARGPFSWAQSLTVLERWDPMRRFAGTLGLNLDGDFTPVAVRLREERGRLRGEVRGTRNLDAVEKQVARIFSLDHDGTGFAHIADPILQRVMRLLPGLRPVCFASPYEAAVWAILSQRISMKQTAALEARLLEEHGVEVGGVRCLPPPDELRRVKTKMPSEKLARLHALADFTGLLDAEKLRALGDDKGPESLLQIPGIGRFWSQGIYLRACGIRDQWPDEPRAQEALLKLGGDPDKWRPFRMWACFVLRVADARGLL